MLQKHIITVDKTCYVSLNNIFIHFSFFILCNFNTMPIFISISQQPFYISCHILTCMAKKNGENSVQILGTYFTTYRLTTLFHLQKLQFHSYHHLVLVPACLLFLHLLAASVTCFSADINCFQSMAAPCSRCKLKFSPQVFFKFMIAPHALHM